MRKDPTEFRKRFAKWKAGAKPYLYGIPYEDDDHNEDGLPKYGNGKSPAKRKQSEADVLKALAPSLDPVVDFEIKGNTEPTGEILLAKKPISESQANSKTSFSDYLDDAEKTATAELAAIYADPERRKNITAEQFFKLYSKTAGYRTRFDRGMGHKGAFLKYIGGIRQESPTQTKGYLTDAGHMVFIDPNSNKRIVSDASGSHGLFSPHLNTVVVDLYGNNNNTLSHEWAHWLYNPKRFGEDNPFFMGAGKNFDKPLAPAYFKWALDNDETSNDQLIHNKRWYEGAADINGTVKYELFKRGIFNPGDPDAEITKDQFNTWYNKSPKNRSVERYGIDDTVNFLNNTASIDNQKYDPNKLASAKYGLENFRLPKFGDGTAQDFRYVKDDQGGWNQVTNDEIGRAFQGMVVTPKKTTVKQAPARINNNLPSYRSSYDPNAIRMFTDYLPIVGTAQTAVDVVDSVKQGNYGTAAALGATMIAPSGIGKVAKGLGTVAKQAISAGSTTVGNYISGLAGFKYGREGRRKAVEKVYEAGLPKFEGGEESVRVGDYNVYPSAIGASELNVTTPEVVVTGKDRRPLYQRYDAEHSTYDPNAAVEGFNALTLGGLNNLSPTQWARRFYDAPKLFSGNMSFSNYTNRWLNGNEGIVSANFEKTHPYASMAVNGGADILTGAAANKLLQVNKLSKLQKMVTGIPNKPDTKTGKMLPQLFREGYNGTVWTSNNPDYAHYFSNGGTKFDIYFDPKKLNLLDTPHAPNGSYYVWNRLPFRAKNGKVSIKPEARVDDTKYVYKTKDLHILHINEYGNIEDSFESLHPYMEPKHMGVNLMTGKKTDHIVRYSKKLNKDGVRFHDMYDGGLEDTSGLVYDIPIEEVVLNPGANYYWTEHGAGKLGLLNKMSYNNTMPWIKSGIINNLTNTRNEPRNK